MLQEVDSDVFVLVDGEGDGEENMVPVVGVASPDIAPPAIEEDEAESVMASAQDQREEELQVGIVHPLLKYVCVFVCVFFLFCF